MFSLIAAVGKNREIGKNGKLIFRIRGDMEFFRDKTMGNTVVMGRKTWNSLPEKLQGRKNVVVSRGEVRGADEVVFDIQGYIARNQTTEEEIFVIGGAKIYQEFLPYADKIYLTEVNATDTEADAFFPEFDKLLYKEKIIKEGQENGLKFTISEYSR